MDETEKPRPEKQGYIPRPPSEEDLREVSEQQKLITDEWAPEPPAKDKPA